MSQKWKRRSARHRKHLKPVRQSKVKIPLHELLLVRNPVSVYFGTYAGTAVRIEPKSHNRRLEAQRMGIRVVK